MSDILVDDVISSIREEEQENIVTLYYDNVSQPQECYTNIKQEIENNQPLPEKIPNSNENVNTMLTEHLKMNKINDEIELKGGCKDNLIEFCDIRNILAKDKLKSTKMSDIIVSDLIKSIKVEEQNYYDTVIQPQEFYTNIKQEIENNQPLPERRQSRNENVNKMITQNSKTNKINDGIELTDGSKDYIIEFCDVNNVSVKDKLKGKKMSNILVSDVISNIKVEEQDNYYTIFETQKCYTNIKQDLLSEKRQSSDESIHSTLTQYSNVNKINYQTDLKDDSRDDLIKICNIYNIVIENEPQNNVQSDTVEDTDIKVKIENNQQPLEVTYTNADFQPRISQPPETEKKDDLSICTSTSLLIETEKQQNDSDMNQEICSSSSSTLKNNTVKKLFQCDVCNKTLSNSSSFAVHKRIHTGERPYACDLCEKAFKMSTELVKHKRIHTGEKPYVCDICYKAFAAPFTLKLHKRIHTGERPYVCDICQKTFLHSTNLVNHKRIHTGEKRYTCDVCQKSFFDRYALIGHKRIHTGERPYICDVCEKSFNHATHLKKHRRIHTGEKPYICDICNMAFTDCSYLLSHKRTHTGEKTHVCDVCNKKFYTNSILTQHKRTHTRERLSYPCDICNKILSTSFTLIAHKRTHTGEKPFVCKVCHKAFAISSGLRKHSRLHNDVDM